MENNLFNECLVKGIQEIICEQRRAYVSSLRQEIIDLVSSKEDEKVIIKKIIDLLNDRFNDSFYTKRGW